MHCHSNQGSAAWRLVLPDQKHLRSPEGVELGPNGLTACVALVHIGRPHDPIGPSRGRLPCVPALLVIHPCWEEMLVSSCNSGKPEACCGLSMELTVQVAVYAAAEPPAGREELRTRSAAEAEQVFGTYGTHLETPEIAALASLFQDVIPTENGSIMAALGCK